MFSPLLPLPFYLCIIAVGVLARKAWRGRTEGWGIPMLAVLGTAGVWYLGDVFYNDYEEYVSMFQTGPLEAAWWEVLLFFIAFGMLVPVMNRKINGHLVGRESHVLQMIRDHSVDTDYFQNQVTTIARALFVPWLILMALGLLRTDFNFIGIFFPYLGEKTDPWGRGRLGGGIDAIYALAGYVQLMLTALWGVVFALSKRSSTFSLAGAVYFLSVPFYVFDRTRSYMLAVLLPGLMALVTLRIKGGIIMRWSVLVFCFLTLNVWFKFVLETRGKGETISSAFQKRDADKEPEVQKAKKHLGFNMYQELGYINYFIANGTYKVNWGTRYFAEIVNPVPRVLWPGKPEIGTDYAIARGMSYGGAAAAGGVAATISTGMIGQGVVNFGVFLGPIASALLMAIWVAVLARQDLMGDDIGHLLLYAIGLVLTYNTGRDITLLVLYPFVFGWLLITFYNRKKRAATWVAF